MLLVKLLSVLACAAAVNAVASPKKVSKSSSKSKTKKAKDRERTAQSVDEYTDIDCSGDISFGHESALIGDVTMDNTSLSAYLYAVSTAFTYEAFTGKTSDGGTCSGDSLGVVPHLECVPLDTAFAGKRIACLKYVPRV